MSDLKGAERRRSTTPRSSVCFRLAGSQEITNNTNPLISTLILLYCSYVTPQRMSLHLLSSQGYQRWTREVEASMLFILIHKLHILSPKPRELSPLSPPWRACKTLHHTLSITGPSCTWYGRPMLGSYGWVKLGVYVVLECGIVTHLRLIGPWVSSG